jgi:hypothetical protein
MKAQDLENRLIDFAVTIVGNANGRSPSKIESQQSALINPIRKI